MKLKPPHVVFIPFVAWLSTPIKTSDDEEERMWRAALASLNSATPMPFWANGMQGHVSPIKNAPAGSYHVALTNGTVTSFRLFALLPGNLQFGLQRPVTSYVH
jgi:hypothetical protein